MVGAIDRYVRIPIYALEQVRLYHVSSALDASIATPMVSTDCPSSENVPTGYTEWAGHWSGSELSLGWDWAVIRGAIVIINPMEIRTNIRILAPDGTSESPMRTRIHLQKWIEQLSWHDVIREVIANG
jgi:hypothetical protein